MYMRVAVLVRFGAVLLFLLGGAARPTLGQSSSSSSAAAPDTAAAMLRADDTTAARGHADGIGAANGRSVVLRGVVGFAAGVPLGFLGVAALVNPQAVTLVVAGASGGIVLAAADAGPRRVPAPLMAAATAHGASYADAYRAGFRHQLQVRRRRAVTVGGGTGALVGAGFAAFLLYALSGT